MDMLPGDEFGESDSAPKRETFGLTRLVRHPVDPMQDFGLSLGRELASTDEWVDLGLTFDTLEDAWLAASILMHLLPREPDPDHGDAEPWLDPVIKVSKGGGPSWSSDTQPEGLDDLNPAISSLLDALRASKRAVEQARDHENFSTFGQFQSEERRH